MESSLALRFVTTFSTVAATPSARDFVLERLVCLVDAATTALARFVLLAMSVPLRRLARLLRRVQAALRHAHLACFQTDPRAEPMQAAIKEHATALRTPVLQSTPFFHPAHLCLPQPILALVFIARHRLVLVQIPSKATISVRCPTEFLRRVRPVNTV